MLVWIYEPLLEVSVQKTAVLSGDVLQIKDGFVSLKPDLGFV